MSERLVSLGRRQSSAFDQKPVAEYVREVREVYLSDRRPWVVGYSGGKDTTATLQLVWYALAGLPADQRTKPVYVISSDTFVETPVIVDYIDQSLTSINRAAKDRALPFEAHKVVPELDDTFWVNLLGRGYPAPSTRFRWCTSRMKIEPANKFILDRVAQFGEVVMVLGARRGESDTRDQVMKAHAIQGSRLRRHSTLPNAFVYAPIEEWTTDDVWQYLLQAKSPWGGDNHRLVALYRNAQAGECPLVVDTSTPSCGNSRFGCWVCTVVQKDQSMEAMIDNGEEWMEPMLEFRNLLAETQDPAKKMIYRQTKRRNGRGVPTEWRGLSFRPIQHPPRGQDTTEHIGPRFEAEERMTQTQFLLLKRLIEAERWYFRHLLQAAGTEQFVSQNERSLELAPDLKGSERRKWKAAATTLVNAGLAEWDGEQLRLSGDNIAAPQPFD